MTFLQFMGLAIEDLNTVHAWRRRVEAANTGYAIPTSVLASLIVEAAHYDYQALKYSDELLGYKG